MATIRPAKLAEGQPGSNLNGGPGDLLQCGIFLVDSLDRVSLVTHGAGRVLKIDGPRKHSVSLKALPRRLQELITEARASGRPIVERQIELPEGADGPQTLRVSALPRVSTGKLPEVTVIVQDLTAARLYEQKLRQLNRLASLGLFSATLAHEIKNALVVGKTFFDLLLEKHRDSELVDLVRRELARIDSLVSQMLRYTRPANSASSEVHLHDVLNHCLRLVDRQLKDKRIHLARAFAAPCDRVRGDDGQLEQAFVNILLNAAEAMGPNGRLTVATEAHARSPARRLRGASTGQAQLRITIQDTGMGIPPENIDRLFGPFFTTKDGGTGLGLSITRRIIEEHGGVISVISEPAQGAAFQILLPSFDPKGTGAEREARPG